MPEHDWLDEELLGYEGDEMDIFEPEEAEDLLGRRVIRYRGRRRGRPRPRGRGRRITRARRHAASGGALPTLRVL